MEKQEGPSTRSNNMTQLTAQDLRLLNRCLEKSLQKDIYTYEEGVVAKYLHQKMDNIVKIVNQKQEEIRKEIEKKKMENGTNNEENEGGNEGKVLRLSGPI